MFERLRRKPKPARPPAITGQPFRDDDPLFSVIVADYEPSVSRDDFRRKMACLAAQTCDDFEVLVYHDGPKARSYSDDLAGAPVHSRTQFFVTPTRVGDWGHSNRDLGIRAAQGRWIIHTNADNLFYSNLIAALKAVLDDREGWTFAQWPRRRYPRRLRKLGAFLNRHLFADPGRVRIFDGLQPQALVYAIVLRGMVPIRGGTVRVPRASHRQGTVLGGFPVRLGHIDAMQMVLRRDIWLFEGGWHDRSKNSDGTLYRDFAQRYRVLPVPVVLGEHW